jgi:hypothetical protein
MNRFVKFTRIIFLVTLLLLSVKLILGNPIKGKTVKVDSGIISYAECSRGRHATPFLQTENSDLKFYVLDDFVYMVDCSENQKTSFIGKSASFTYFKNSSNSGKIIEISVDGRQIYTQTDFLGKTFATGVILFFVVVLFGVWSFYSAKDA